MKKLGLLSVMIALFLLTGTLNAQISISDLSGQTADASAVLDVKSNSLGMLTPRLTTTQRTGITSPATGLLVYDTNFGSFFYYDGSAWVDVSSDKLWSRTGTDTYLANMNDNVVIGTNTSGPGYKLYVHGATSQMSRFDGQVEFWDVAGGSMDADINDDGLGNGVINVYDNTGLQRISLPANGNSLFNGGAVCIGGTTPQALLHIFDNNGFGAPQIILDNISGTANTGVGYRYGAVKYSQGIEPSTSNFVLCNTLSVNPPFQGDGSSLISGFQSGIIDLNNQSRARVFLAENEAIPPSTWHPIDYTMVSYDQHFEWTPGTGSPVGGPPMSFFTATEEGYYQVNARTEYFLGEEMDNWWVNYDAYVSIAIYKADIQNNWFMYAQGNNLQIGQIWNPQGPMENGLSFKNNNAPNVSDVVYLQKGEKIAIYTWQSSGITLHLVPGTVKTYCSVHKSS